MNNDENRTSSNLTDALQALHELTKLPLQVLNDAGDALLTCGGGCAYCRLFAQYLPEGESCRLEHARAAQRALELGEAYIFCCHANVNHIVLPLAPAPVPSEDGSHAPERAAAVLAGPFLINPPDALLLQEVEKHYDIPASALLDMYEAVLQLCVMTPREVSAMSRLMLYLFEPAGDIRVATPALQSKRDMQRQQSRIGETIQMYKASAASTYPYGKERELIARVKTGDTDGARAILNELLGYTLFSEGSDTDTIKSRAVELCSLLSRAAIESGAPAESTLEAGRSFARSLWMSGVGAPAGSSLPFERNASPERGSPPDLEQLCYRLQTVVEFFANSVFEQRTVKNSSIVTKAIRYIAMNYAQDVSLTDAAAHVHLNPTYFSTVFKQAAGTSFSEYLNMVRVEEGRRLLETTDYDVTRVALEVGFASQNYFSKVFKAHIGVSPREYRLAANVPK